MNITFVDGVYQPNDALPAGIQFNIANAETILSVANNLTIEEPIQLSFLNKKNQINQIKNKIILGENSFISIIEKYDSLQKSSYTTHAQMELQLKENARLHYYKIQNESVLAEHHATILISQNKMSSVKTFLIDLGGAKTFQAIKLNCLADATESNLYAIYALSYLNQQLQHHVLADHRFSRASSLMHYKGILTNRAKAIFNGKVLVHKNLTQINAQQKNDNLLLCQQAEAISKPELEIYSDDIKCTHGATSGQLDPDALFYLRSRGFDEKTALSMLTQAFASEVLEKIELANIKNYLADSLAAMMMGPDYAN